MKIEAKSRGRSAVIAALISSFMIGASLSIGSTALVLSATLFGLVYTGARTWDWLRYRGENGLKF